MSKVASFATLLVLALSFVSMSCSGVVFPFANPSAAGPTTNPSAQAAPAIAVATPSSHSPELFLVGGGLVFFAVLGSSIYVCRPQVN
jgi:hypothetical protein